MESKQLEELKKEYETLSLKLQELSEDELKQVIGGVSIEIPGLEKIGPYNYDCSGLVSKTPDKFGLLQTKPKDNVEFTKIEINGQLKDRIDYSGGEWKPLFK